VSEQSAEAPVIQVDPDAAVVELGGRAIGAHLPLGPGLDKAVERARTIGATAMQVFSDNPTSWRRRTDPPAGIERFRTSLDRAGVGQLAIHAAYLVNLASPDDEVRERSVATMVSELEMGARYGARIVTVHIGSHKGAGLEPGLDRAGETIARILERVPATDDAPLLVLEDSAGQGDTVGVTIGEIGTIIAAAERYGADPARIGVCLDTAHLWGAGFDLDDPAAIDRMLADLDATCGPERLSLIHLNDSRAGRGSRMDRHEHIGGGGIGETGLRHLVNHPRLANVPMVLETPGMDTGWDAVNMDRVRSLLNDRPLTALPEGAREVRGGRGGGRAKAG